MLIDPRQGDIEDDAASPGQRSLLAIAGSLLVEISLPKLLFAWTVLLLLPAVLLGLAPLLASAWFSKLSDRLAAYTGIGTAIALIAIVALGWIGWRPLFRIAETSFWSLNALAVQPGYAFAREALRHLTERMWGRKLTLAGRARLRSANSIGAAVILSACAVLIALAAWPASRWTGQLERPGLAASPRCADACECCRAAVRISGGGIAGLGICGCQHAATRRSRRVRYPVPWMPQLARGASVGHSRDRRTIWLSHRKRTLGPSAATAGSRESLRILPPFMQPIRSTIS
jgi:hypothetical protein